MIEIVFSFILNTWTGMSEVNAWASEHLSGVHMMSKVKKEGQILCALERGRLLVYDTRWKKEERIEVPTACHQGLSGEEILTSLRSVEFRSETLLSTPVYSAWDQKIDVRIEGEPAFTLFVRQDKKYIGAHSTNGWSIWIERKTGHLRFEYINIPSQEHFRMKAHGDINPVKGGVTHLTSVQALHVTRESGRLSKAHILTGKKEEGFSHITFARDNETWKKILHRCGEVVVCKEAIGMSTEENKLDQFADIESKKFKDFVEKGRPLAFDQVIPDQLVPPMALFR